MKKNPILPIVFAAALFLLAYYNLPFEKNWLWPIKAFFSSLPAILLGWLAYSLVPERMKED